MLSAVVISSLLLAVQGSQADVQDQRTVLVETTDQLKVSSKFLITTFLRCFLIVTMRLSLVQ
jgi:hypothetical protein